MSVLVVHPQVQHSRKLVGALVKKDILTLFVTSVFQKPRFAALLPNALARRFDGRYDASIPAGLVKTVPLFEIVWLCAARLLRLHPVNPLLYYNLWAFDRFVSIMVPRLAARIVVGYETASLHIFRQAKRSGKLCVLDAASVHFQSQESSDSLPPGLRAKINARKIEEIRLADRILVLSTYARETYIANGVDESRITVVPLGIDTSLFAPPAPPRRPPQNGIRFLFVGNVTYSKGIDLLLDAYKAAAIPGKSLCVVGAPGDAAHLLKKDVPNLEYRGFVPHEQLVDIYQEADVFVFPSRLDGFGMVVTEAMATGLPVIVSSHVGAKDLVRDGETGWIFDSGKSEALCNTMERAFAFRRTLPEIGLKGCADVKEYSWDRYQQTIGDYFNRLLSELQERE